MSCKNVKARIIAAQKISSPAKGAHSMPLIEDIDSINNKKKAKDFKFNILRKKELQKSCGVRTTKVSKPKI